MSNAADADEFTDVNQFYETVLGFGLFFVVLAQFLILKFDIWMHIDRQITEEEEDYQKWLGQQQEESKPDDIQKEIDVIENKTNPNDGPQVDNSLLAELSDQQKRYLSLYRQVNIIFNEYLPIVFCTMILGTVTASTMVFSLAMFFCFIFSATVFNYTKLYNKLKKQYKSKTFQPYLGLLSSLFILALYGSYFIRQEYFGVNM